MKKASLYLVALAMVITIIPGPVSAATQPQPTITAASGKQATAGGTEQFKFGGTADPSAEFRSARIIPIAQDGTFLTPHTSLSSNEVQVSDGAITGQGYSRPPPQGTYGYVLEVTVAVGAEMLTGISEVPLRLDLVNPYVKNYSLVAPDTILVRFSELVTYPNATGDGTVSGSAFDWTVNDGEMHVLSVSGEGSTRLLTLSDEYGLNDEPLVEYISRAPLSRTYTDEVDREVASDIHAYEAFDAQPPQTPTIQTIAGRSGSTVLANNASPSVVAGNVTAGDSAQLVDSEGNTIGDPKVVPTGATSVSLPLGSVQEGQTDFRAEAFEVVDTYERTSDDQSKPTKPATQINRSSMTQGRYILDTVVPSVVSAEPVDNNYLQVVFTEPVFGTGNIGDWKVGGGTYPVAGVIGDGNSRLLRVSGVAAGTAVAYSPVTGARLVDAAGNVLGSFTKATTTAQPGSSGTGGGGTTTSPSPTPTTTPTTTPGGGSGGTPTPGPTQTPAPTPSPSPTQTPVEPTEEIQARAAEDDATAGACQDVAVTFYRNGSPAAGENIDVTLADGLEFCDGTQGLHAEAFTDSSGTAVFRILSRSTRTVSILAWHDKDDDDITDSNEKRKSVELTWKVDGARSLTIKGKHKVTRGKKIRLRGTVTAVMRRCEVDTAIEIVRQRGSGVKVIDAVFSQADGSFSKRVRVTKTGMYFARAQSIGGCDEAYSQGLLVKALRRKH